ncbi:MAG: penicillin-binding protein [Bacteroidetes bacterium]|nr:penicillin-binding protein [Bacteroidota bacterium]
MISKKFAFLFSALAILLLTQPWTATAQPDRVDSCVNAQMSNRHIPGLALAVIRDGIPVKVKGYGFANIELGVPVSPQTIFQSGSVGKQFTSMLVMLLVEQGKIRLDEPISNYFANSPPAWKTITVRHLLTHTSGIPDYEQQSLLRANDTSVVNLRFDYTEDQLLDKAKALPLDFQPGEKWSYSNTGYVLLGILIRKVSGQFYGDLLKQRVFQPLSMETARIINEADIIPNRAAGYRLEKGEWKNQEWVSPSLNTTADGSLYFTILDLIKWDAALSAGRVLSRASYDQMWSPMRLTGDSLHPYGFGWSLGPVNGRKTVSHGGAWQGFNTFSMFLNWRRKFRAAFRTKHPDSKRSSKA